MSEILIRELDTMESSWPLLDASHVRNELGIILFAMTALNAKYPLIGVCLIFLNDKL